MEVEHDDAGGFCLSRKDQTTRHGFGAQVAFLPSEPSAMAFCTYEATFISVKEPKPGKFPRSKSAGANVPRPPCPVTSYVESLEKRASALTFLEPQVGSAGSSGHPELCFKPCLYLAYGSCPSGTSCNFCHLPHPNRAKYGRDRELLRQLSEADLLGLILPHLRAKILGA